MKHILLTGANGVVGYPLSQRLSAERVVFRKTSRKPVNDELCWDLQQAPEQAVLDELKSDNIDTLIHCAPIWLLPAHLKSLFDVGVRRIVVFSSSSVTSKQNSSDHSERKLVQQLSQAENAIQQFCNQRGVAFTIFRPSLIYGYGRDQNITQIAKFINRYGFMLLVGEASGLRQPVHADDLVDASLDVLDNTLCLGKTYHLGGAEILTYRAMVEKIFAGLNKKPRILSLPLPLFRLGLRVAAVIGRFSYTPEMANRMNQNLNYDITPAKIDFAYSPQVFLGQAERDLPLESRAS